MNVWTEHRNPEGRTYWFNTGTKESVWEKPDELKTSFEKALNQTKWKEYFSGGRKYYYNTDTKESKWDLPEELQQLMKTVEDETKSTPALAPTPAIPVSNGVVSLQGAIVPMGNLDPSSFLPGTQPIPLDGVSGALGAHTGGVVSGTLQGALPARPNLPDDPVIPHNGFATFEEGEKAFIHLLRKAGVDANWSWDQTMRTIITDPLYKALNTLAEKKATWQKYTEGLKAKEAEERDARLSKQRPAIRNMLKGNPNVHSYTTFTTADKLFAQHPIWQQARIESERKMIFEEYVTELKQREMQEQRVARTRALTKVVSLLKELQVDVLTKWREAHRRLLDSKEWQADPELRALPSLDILLAFEDYARAQEREFEEQMRRSQVEKKRKERKAREAFKELLYDLAKQGHIRARTKWKQVYLHLKEDERYTNMLGIPGSNPLELFWDAVDELDQALDTKMVATDLAIRVHNEKLQAEVPTEAGPDGELKEAKSFTVGPGTSMQDFMEVVGDDPEVKKLSGRDLEEIFNTMHADAAKKHEDEKRRAERKQRHLQDDLRYALKKLSEPIDVSMSFEQAVPIMEHLPEFKALEDEGRRAAFAKYIKRQKERMREASEDGGSASGRRRKEPPRDYRDDRDYDRSREYERGSSKYEYRGGYRDKDYRDKDRDSYSHRSSRHGREQEREDRRRGSRSWEDGAYAEREKRDLPYDEKGDDRAEKRARYDRESTADAPARSASQAASGRAETPEEGEI